MITEILMLIILKNYFKKEKAIIRKISIYRIETGHETIPFYTVPFVPFLILDLDRDTVIFALQKCQKTPILIDVDWFQTDTESKINNFLFWGFFVISDVGYNFSVICGKIQI